MRQKSTKRLSAHSTTKGPNMTIDFILPDIGEGIVECELLEWLVSEGDLIEEDQPVAEVMTDKATVQIPAMHSGTVTKLYYKEGDIAAVHAPLFAMETTAGPSTEPTTTRNATQDGVDLPHQVDSPALKTPDGQDDVHEDFILPDIGEGIVECEIVKWNVKEGDLIAEDQSVVEVMTDKAVVEIPAKYSGVVGTLYYAQGDIAKVHSPLFSLVRKPESGEVKRQGITDRENCEPLAANQDIGHGKRDYNSSVKSPEKGDKWSSGDFEPPVVIPGKVLASPAVRRIAREQNFDLHDIKGTGKKGRILKQDVLTHLEKSTKESKGGKGSHTPTLKEMPNQPQETNSVKTVKVRGVQAAMAKQMVASVSTIPHFTVSDELLMDNLIALRQRLKPVFEEKGVKLSLMPFFIKALSLALSEFDIINSQLNDDASELSYFNDHNIGFAVDTKIGLLVPNIKQVQQLSIFNIATQIQEIIDEARKGQIASHHLKGGTISISNIGAIGGITATPVINKPEAAIVALGKIQSLPRFTPKGEVVAQQIMMVNWSGDHRIIDGATMVKFNNLWMSYLQAPEKMLMHLR